MTRTPLTPAAGVVVVGGGPVGVALALSLGTRGVPCTLVEKRTELSAIPKGQGLSQRTMEHFARWGLADELRAARTMTQGHAIGQVTVYESLMGEFWHAAPGRELVAPYYAQRNERLPQYRTEAVLRRRMAELEGVTARFGWAATAVEQDADGVRVTVERDGEREVVEGAYVVGCDGARSLVRDQGAIPSGGTDFDQVMALVVFRSRELHEALARFPERSTYRVVHPDLQGYWLFFGRVDSSEQWFFHAPVPADSDPATFDAAGLVRRAAGLDLALEVEHVGFWDLRVQVAQDYRHGRAFLAGDAAHTHPPYGGFGLNMGLEDAVNLGWKLAAVLQGWGGERLLDSYSLERQPVFRDLGEDMIAGGIEHERGLLERYSPDRDREEFARVFADIASSFGRQQRGFEPHYDGSPVVAGPPDGVTGAQGEHSLDARPGHHLAPAPLSSGSEVFEALGQGFTLLALDAPDGAVAAFEQAASAAGVPLTVVRDSRDGGREAYGAGLVLVRPDQFVAWTGEQAPTDVPALLALVTGRVDA